MRPSFLSVTIGCLLHVICYIIRGLPAAYGQCSGTTVVYTALDDYQVFTSLSYPFGYGNDQSCTWRIEADNVTDAIRMEITDASIEYHADCVYDYGEVYDGYNVTAASLGKFCGTANPGFVSTENYMTVIFISDYSLYSRGFKARYKSGPRWTLVDAEPEEESFSMLAILGVSLGAVVFILVVTALVYTYIQAKKAKEMRRNPNMRRGMSRIRVEPYDFRGGWSYLDGPAPPAYGEIYSSPMSPPPGYSEMDPNPNPSAPLPGRAEYIGEQQNANTSSGQQRSSQRADTNANTHFVLSNGINRHVEHGVNTAIHRTLHTAQSHNVHGTSGNPGVSQNQMNTTVSVVSSATNNHILTNGLPNSAESTGGLTGTGQHNVGQTSLRTSEVNSTNVILTSHGLSEGNDSRSVSSVSEMFLPSTRSVSTAPATAEENITPVN